MSDDAPILEFDPAPTAVIEPGAQVLYAGDDLSGDAWDERGWDEHTTGRETLFRIAAEVVLSLPPDPLPVAGGEG